MYEALFVRVVALHRYRTTLRLGGIDVGIGPNNIVVKGED